MYFNTNPTPGSRAGSRGSFVSSSLSSRRRWSATSLRRISGLGAHALFAPALGDDSQILAQVFQGQSGAPAAPLVQQTVQQAMNQGALWTKENCSGIPSGSTAALVTTAAGQMAIKVGEGGLGRAGLGFISIAAAPIVAAGSGPLLPIVLAAGGILELFGAIFGHHAAKVRQERQIICAVVQSVNDSLTVIDQALQSGQISIQQASGSLDKLYSDLQANVQPILKQDHSHCNAACFILAEARGVIAKRKDLYSQIVPPSPPPMAPAPSQVGPGSSSVANPAPSGGQISSPADLVNYLTTSTGIPSWAVWGLAALLVVKVIE